MKTRNFPGRVHARRVAAKERAAGRKMCARHVDVPHSVRAQRSKRTRV